MAAPPVSPEAAAELAARLVAVDSTNPDLTPGAAGEGRLAELVAGWLGEHGVAARRQPVAPGRENVIGVVPGRGGGPRVLLCAHLDTVAAGGPQAGVVPLRRGGRLYGRGAADMKSGLAAALLATAGAVGRRLAGDVVLAAVADEEGESKGTQRLLAGYTADTAIVLEPTAETVVVAHRGFVWAEIVTRGVPAHGSDPATGVDAVLAMGHVLAELDGLAFALRTDPDGHPLLGTGSLHAGVIEGGREPPSYPARCRLVVERRTLPEDSDAQVLGELRAAVERARARSADPRWGARTRLLVSRPPLATPTQAPVVRALRSACRAVLGTDQVGGAPFWTDAALLAAAGIPSAVFGVTGGGLHADREWVEVASIARVVAVLHAALGELAGPAG